MNLNPITSFLVLACLLAGVAVGYSINPTGYRSSLPWLFLSRCPCRWSMWQKFVILRMGRLQSVKGAGLFTIIPILDSVAAVIDVRIQTLLSMPSRR